MQTHLPYSAFKPNRLISLQVFDAKVEVLGKDGDTLFHWITDVSPHVSEILHWYRVKNRGIPSFSIEYDEERRLFRMQYEGLGIKSFQQRVANPENDDYNLALQDHSYPFRVIASVHHS